MNREINREIKFRGWHPDDKVMVYDLNTPQLYHGVLQSYRHKEKHDYVFMQCIGLLDKNEKEIYEGDLVRTTDINSSDSIIRKVVYYESHAAFFLENLKDEALSHFGYDFIADIEYEVLGNIYENPKFLKKK